MSEKTYYCYKISIKTVSANYTARPNLNFLYLSDCGIKKNTGKVINKA